MTRICSQKCIVCQFCLVNITEWTHTNLDGTACDTTRLYGVASAPGPKPTQHVTVLNTVGNCNTAANTMCLNIAKHRKGNVLHVMLMRAATSLGNRNFSVSLSSSNTSTVVGHWPKCPYVTTMLLSPTGSQSRQEAKCFCVPAKKPARTMTSQYKKEVRLGMVAHTCNPSWRGWGGWITWGQEFEISLTNLVKSHLN